MNFEADDLLDRVDQWKFKLHEKLKDMAPEERATFWKQARAKAHAAGLLLAKPEVPLRGKGKRGPRATG